jgi:leucyl aminopeptidase
MSTYLSLATKKKQSEVNFHIFLTTEKAVLDAKNYSKQEIEFFNLKRKEKQTSILISKYPQQHLYLIFDKKEINDINGNNKGDLHEEVRRLGAKALDILKANKIKKAVFKNLCENSNFAYCFAEGLALANYQFINYKQNLKDATSPFEELIIDDLKISETEIKELLHIIESVVHTRDLVNEPVAKINSVSIAKQFQKLGKLYGFNVEVFNKAKIVALKMNGLLTVNKGSQHQPTFTVMEYKPKGAKNTKPIVLVGKGVVYDTGGYNIKVGTGMETMKCDMAGAAAVAGTMCAIAANRLNVHVIGLVPATDNFINQNAYVAGDIITYSNGKTAEILNTDAEGRLILADALIYAQKFNPELVIDLATLTGAAAAAIGKYGCVAMCNRKANLSLEMLEEIGNESGDRVAKFPFWEDYDELIKSDIAEIKNIGGPYGGAITAGKFLSNFVDYPWIHLDIAGPAYIESNWNYRPKGGTGYGVRLLYNFLK